MLNICILQYILSNENKHLFPFVPENFSCISNGPSILLSSGLQNIVGGGVPIHTVLKIAIMYLHSRRGFQPSIGSLFTVTVFRPRQS